MNEEQYILSRKKRWVTIISVDVWTLNDKSVPVSLNEWLEKVDQPDKYFNFRFDVRHNDFQIQALRFETKDETEARLLSEKRHEKNKVEAEEKDLLRLLDKHGIPEEFKGGESNE